VIGSGGPSATSWPGSYAKRQTWFTLATKRTITEDDAVRQPQQSEILEERGDDLRAAIGVDIAQDPNSASVGLGCETRYPFGATASQRDCDSPSANSSARKPSGTGS
jgi:hypothetical protein